MHIPKLLLVCALLLAATLTTVGCNDPYQPVSNPNAAEEAAMKRSRENAKAVRLAAEKQAEAIRQAQAQAQQTNTAAGK